MGTVRHQHSRRTNAFKVRVALEVAGIQSSWDWHGRALDSVFIERLWRAVTWKEVEVYLTDYQTVADAVNGLSGSFRFYDHDWPHQALGYRTPAHLTSTVWPSSV